MSKIVKELTTNRHARIAYIVATVFSVCIFTVGFFVPPMGKIDGSVLIAGGSVMLFTLAVIAIQYRAGLKLEVDLDDRQVTLSTSKECHHEEN